MNLKNWKYARMDLTAGAIILAAGVLFYVAGVQPVKALADQQSLLQTQVRQQRENATETVAKVREIRQELAIARKALANSPVHLQAGNTVNARLGKLSALAVKYELKVDEIQPAEATYGPNYGFVPIRLVGRGNYRTWTAFLHQLTQSFSDMSVDSFELSAKPGAAAEFHVNLRWYVSPTPAANVK
jgi:Tfp pilus assembly protein PilO